MVDAGWMVNFAYGEMGVSEFIEVVLPPGEPTPTIFDGVHYEDALEFAEELITRGEKAQLLKDALLKMAEQRP
ncbi:MAG: hypothetical protein FWF99_00105 [Desulfovibrionaceae bacterium]|nr:hypothetical protein [Desulfovibrionaceae bacterium]